MQKMLTNSNWPR